MNWQRFTEAIRNGSPDPWWDSVYHGGGKGAPAAPDYAGAAQQQGAASQQLATQNTWANRPNVSTPWGSQTWNAGTGTDPSTGQPITTWQQNINLSPEQQAAQDAQAKITQGRSEAAGTLLGQATGEFQTPFDWSNLPSTPGSVSGAQTSAYDTMHSALQPQRDRDRASLETRLANTGLPMGSEAYKNAKQDLESQFSLQDKGVMSQALSEGRADIGAQQGLRSAAIAEQAQRRGMPLNELNSLLTGQQVSMPQMPSFAPAGQAQTPDLLGAAQAQGQYGLGAAGLNQQRINDYSQLVAGGSGLAMAALF